MRQFTIGLVIGLALLLVVGGVLGSLLVGISSSDLVTYLLVVSVLTIVAALACGSRRAVRPCRGAAIRVSVRV